MDKRVAEFVNDVAQTIVGLDVALYLQDNPRTFDTAAGLALRLRHPVEAIEPVVERFADYGLLRKVIPREGSYTCYSLTRTPAMWHLLCLISESYIDNPDTRKEIVRMLVSRGRKHAETNADSPQSSDA
jgi:hypothetical protein